MRTKFTCRPKTYTVVEELYESDCMATNAQARVATAENQVDLT